MKMDKSKFTSFFKNVQNGLSKHSPEILIGIGITSMITGAVYAVKVTPKALEKIKEEEEIKQEPLTKKEIVKVSWKYYAPSALSMIVGSGCIIGSNSIHAKRNATLATMYKISETALTEFREKAIEVVGEEKTKEIRDKIVETKEAKASKVIILDNEKVLMYEPISNTYFKANKSRVREAVLELNGRMVDGMEMYISLNEFLDELRIPRSVVGNDIGWAVDKRIDLTFELHESEDGEPCFAIAYLQPPFHEYNKLY